MNSRVNATTARFQFDWLYLVGSCLHGNDGIKRDQHDHDSHASQHRWPEVLEHADTVKFINANNIHNMHNSFTVL